MVLILKGGGDYHGIDLVKVILNCHFTTTITYHDSLHGFQAGRGMGTATLEVKMLQKVAALREAVLHAILLDLHKAYNALDRSRYLGILEGYVMGTMALCLLRRCWEKLKILARAAGY